MESKNILSIMGGAAILVLIILIFGVGFGFWRVGKYQGGLFVATDKTGYNSGDTLKFKVKNSSEEKICFSSCYPYYFERTTDPKKWEAYQYSECKHQNLAGNCVDLRQTKAFLANLPPSLEKKSHRLAIPVCTDCDSGSVFKVDKWLYTNEFIIK